MLSDTLIPPPPSTVKIDNLESIRQSDDRTSPRAEPDNLGSPHNSYHSNGQYSGSDAEDRYANSSNNIDSSDNKISPKKDRYDDESYDKRSVSPESSGSLHDDSIEGHSSDFTQPLPSNLNHFRSPFSAEEARLRYCLESGQFKDQPPFSPYGSRYVDETLRNLSYKESRNPFENFSSVGNLPTSPDGKLLTSSPLTGSPLSQSFRPSSLPGGHNLSFDDDDSALVPSIREGLYFCHLCSFSGSTQQDFDSHMTIHFEHVCPHCDYKSRTEGRLKRHIKDFHTDDPDSQRTMPGRPKVFRCKQCEYSSTDKVEFWTHSRTHIKEDKLLQCPRCPFVTEYKHHLEYHLRNHFGSKPFKCPKCNYACVNKSMLNSHMKSHTNVYQYRCADCTYATKYCHSLKLHLRKYNHKPAAVLNSDGSLPQGVDATASGLSLLAKRGPPRGPRGPRKDKLDQSPGGYMPMHPGHIGHMPGMPGMMSPFWPMLQGQIPTSMPNPLGLGPRFNSHLPQFPSLPGLKSEDQRLSQIGVHVSSQASSLKCSLCSFIAPSREVLTSHVLKVHATENHDLFSIFGLSSESLLEDKRMNAMNAMNTMNMLKSPSPKSRLHQMYGSIPGFQQHHIKKEIPEEFTKKDSRPPVSIASHLPATSQPLSPYSFMKGRMPEGDSLKDKGIDILKQMTLKFGSGPMSEHKAQKQLTAVDSPLDLTKPMKRSLPPSMHYPEQISSQPDQKGEEGEHSSGENSVYSSGVTSPPPRKRSRKGQAFKLDTLCMRLQEKHNSAYMSGGEDSGDDIDEMYSSDLLPVEADDIGSEGEHGNEEMMEEMDREQQNGSDDGMDKTPEPGSEDGDRHRGNKEERDETDGEMADMELERLHSNLTILNERRAEEKSKDVDDEKNDNEVSINDADSAKISSASSPTSEDNNIVQSSTSPVMSSQRRRKPVPAAIQRGADIAWKILNDPKITDPSELISNGGNGHRLELSALDRKLWTEAPDCTTAPGKGDYQCSHCRISFGDCIMYTMHMGYHGYKDPYKCNMCGDTCKDRVEFFLHIARAAHN